MVTRAVVSARIPQGICIIYHSPERTIGVPKSPLRGGRRAGGHNSLTRVRLKPVLMAGGYGAVHVRLQLLGADRLQPRHVRASCRSSSGSNGEGGRSPMNVRAQVSMVFHLDKCIGCHTCSIACKNVWTDRKGTEYMWWNNVETKPGTGYPTLWEDQEHYRGGWERNGKGLKLQLQGSGRDARQPLHNPNLPTMDDYYEPWTYALRGPVQRARGRRPADRAADLAGHRRADRHRGRAELGRRPRRLARLRRERSQPRRS